MILFDDIGSYPLPKNVNKSYIVDAIKRCDPISFEVIRDAILQKIKARVDVPTYPQFRDMTQQFLEIIKDESITEEPMLIRKENARIIELAALETVGRDYYNKTGMILNVRICVTGPLELYLKEFGATAYKDILNTLSVSVNRFIENSIDNAKQFKIATVSIDEPSIGINPQIMFSNDDLIEALEKASKTAVVHEIDTEIHLHSPLHYNIICEVPSINIIGVESAANPSYIDLIDRKDLEDYDKFLRVGISRTDIFNMAAFLNEKYNTNVWKDQSKLDEILSNMETPYNIGKRLENAWRLFGERIKYAGPDCGLGSWPTQELAFGLLENTGTAIKEFLKKN